jgi:tRNA-splicing ligase RtcB
MIRRALEILEYAAARAGGPLRYDESNLVNIHHNYAARERHFGRELWLHRKGATLATRATTGLIPGSMGTKSYVVRGLGNPDSFQSCSHGAGRALSRSQARNRISKEDLKQALGPVRVLHKSDMRDEAPQAYKSIAEVMENQSDLVETAHELTPLAGIKG